MLSALPGSPFVLFSSVSPACGSGRWMIEHVIAAIFKNICANAQLGSFLSHSVCCTGAGVCTSRHTSAGSHVCKFRHGQCLRLCAAGQASCSPCANDDFLQMTAVTLLELEAFPDGEGCIRKECCALASLLPEYCIVRLLKLHGNNLCGS